MERSIQTYVVMNFFKIDHVQAVYHITKSFSKSGWSLAPQNTVDSRLHCHLRNDTLVFLIVTYFQRMYFLIRYTFNIFHEIIYMY